MAVDRDGDLVAVDVERFLPVGGGRTLAEV
jgi:hypothetical protein